MHYSSSSFKSNEPCIRGFVYYYHYVTKFYFKGFDNVSECDSWPWLKGSVYFVLSNRDVPNEKIGQKFTVKKTPSDYNICTLIVELGIGSIILKFLASSGAFLIIFYNIYVALGRKKEKNFKFTHSGMYTIYICMYFYEGLR